MIKNIGKLKQWTGEKFGSVKTTLQTEDFQRLEVETERKRIGFEKLHAAAAIMQIQLSKKKISPEDNKSKRMPNDILGVCLSNYGNEFTDDAPLGVALINFGQAQSRLASFQEEYAETMKSDYMEKLDEGLQQFKEYTALRKKLESRRLDYDSKLGRLQKSKKENPGLEQEVQASKMKFEDSEYDVIQKMAALQEFEDEHCEALQNFLEVQFEYFNRSLEVLNEVKSNWGAQASGTRHNNSNSRRTALSRTSSNNSNGDEAPATTMLRSPAGLSSISRKGSSVDVSSNLVPPPPAAIAAATRRAPGRRSSSFSDREDLPIPSTTSRAALSPPVLPRRQSQTTPDVPMRNQRKAVYDFGGDNADELSFRVGDMITVIEEVDEGWWLGEVIEPHGQVRRGIFPVNYTELVSNGAGPPMPARPNLSSTTTMSQQSFIAEHPDEYVDEPTHYQPQQQETEPSPFGDANRSLNNAQRSGYSYIRPNQPTRTLSANTISSPASSPRPAPAAPAVVTKRAPPPPPASRTPPVVSSRSSNTRATRTAPTTPQVHVTQTDNYFESTTAACMECGCNDFTANVFKKGHCNNCFHKH